MVIGHAWAGRYVDSLRVRQIKKKSKLMVHNNIKTNMLHLDPLNELVWTACLSFLKKVHGIFYQIGMMN